MKPPGRVFLVGSGPGDPGLMTLRGCRCLQQADVVLYDYLVNPQILEHARDGAELVCLGRHGQGRILSQDEVNRRMIDESRQGRTVVRLKGGDPAVFARGADEMEALSAAGLAFETVPGITAALAAGSYSGIPITDREAASAVAFVTGQEGSDKQGAALDYDALARFPGTLVFYMGATTASQWSGALISAGKSTTTPAAIVRRCTWPDQEVIRTTLGKVADALAARNMRPPVIVLVGSVVESSAAADWFARRPLFGQTVLVTRPREQARGMRDRLAELGADVLVQPAIEISDPPTWRPLDDAIARLGEFDWLVFSSANGVQYFLRRLRETGGDLRRLGGIKIAAIGPATVDALAGYLLTADLQPGEYRAEALAEALAAEAQGKRFLLARASRGREVLVEELTAAGATVEQVVVYSSTDITSPCEKVTQALEAGRIDWTTVTSSAIARSLVGMFRETLRNTRLVTISPLTSNTLREMGYEPDAEAVEYTTGGVIEVMLAAAAGS